MRLKLTALPALLLATWDALPLQCFSCELRQHGCAKQVRNAATIGCFARAPVSKRRIVVS